MKHLELIYTEKTKELLKEGKDFEKYEFYLLDLDLLGKQRNISIAVIKVLDKDNYNETILDKALKAVEELYSNEDYIVTYDKL